MIDSLVISRGLVEPKSEEVTLTASGVGDSLKVSSTVDWATVHDAESGAVASVDGWYAKLDSGRFYCQRFVFTVPELSAQIKSATIKITRATTADTPDSYLHVLNRLVAGTTSPEDYSGFGDAVSEKTSAVVSAESKSVITYDLNAAGVAALNNGQVDFMVRDFRDTENIEPNEDVGSQTSYESIEMVVLTVGDTDLLFKGDGFIATTDSMQNQGGSWDDLYCEAGEEFDLVDGVLMSTGTSVLRGAIIDEDLDEFFFMTELYIESGAVAAMVYDGYHPVGGNLLQAGGSYYGGYCRLTKTDTGYITIGLFVSTQDGAMVGCGKSFLISEFANIVENTRSIYAATLKNGILTLFFNGTAVVQKTVSGKLTASGLPWAVFSRLDSYYNPIVAGFGIVRHLFSKKAISATAVKVLSGQSQFSAFSFSVNSSDAVTDANGNASEMVNSIPFSALGSSFLQNGESARFLVENGFKSFNGTQFHDIGILPFALSELTLKFKVQSGADAASLSENVLIGNLNVVGAAYYGFQTRFYKQEMDTNYLEVFYGDAGYPTRLVDVVFTDEEFDQAFYSNSAIVAFSLSANEWAIRVNDRLFSGLRTGNIGKSPNPLAIGLRRNATYTIAGTVIDDIFFSVEKTLAAQLMTM